MTNFLFHPGEDVPEVEEFSEEVWMDPNHLLYKKWSRGQGRQDLLESAKQFEGEGYKVYQTQDDTGSPVLTIFHPESLRGYRFILVKDLKSDPEKTQIYYRVIDKAEYDELMRTNELTPNIKQVISDMAGDKN